MLNHSKFLASLTPAHPRNVSTKEFIHTKTKTNYKLMLRLRAMKRYLVWWHFYYFFSFHSFDLSTQDYRLWLIHWRICKNLSFWLTMVTFNDINNFSTEKKFNRKWWFHVQTHTHTYTRQVYGILCKLTRKSFSYIQNLFPSKMWTIQGVVRTISMKRWHSNHFLVLLGHKQYQ